MVDRREIEMVIMNQESEFFSGKDEEWYVRMKGMRHASQAIKRVEKKEVDEKEEEEVKSTEKKSID